MVAVLTAQPGQAEGLKQALLRLVAHSRTEPGVIQYDLHQVAERPDQFAFYEIWADEQSLDAHRNSTFMAEHRRRVADLVATIDRMPLVRLTD
jgi:quinol monooxygenase YgiN